jgi:pimeloyl-ACP methyl ester carboxylesterase
VRLPVLLVHGLHDTPGSFKKMRRHLEAAGHTTESVALLPNDGSAPIERLAALVREASTELLARTYAPRLDVVGFSMGALASRVFIQRLGGAQRVRRFVSISGPHAGSWLARLGWGEGVRDMRPGSPLLRALEADEASWGEVEVHVLYTPLDLMILPAKSSLLTRARTTKAVPVVLHPLMLGDKRVLHEVAALLGAPEGAFDGRDAP